VEQTVRLDLQERAGVVVELAANRGEETPPHFDRIREAGAVGCRTVNST
jgi:hypothetical protein